jgi:predicted PurR-regulated permease PerM
MVDTVRGTVNGTILIAVVEGALIGVAYFAAGVPHALLFALLTMAFATIPFGAWAVFTSASVLLLLHGGSAVAAASVFAVGAAVMIIGDLFVWAALVGGAARLPFLLALIGIFGATNLRAHRIISWPRNLGCAPDRLERVAYASPKLKPARVSSFRSLFL